ncbi:hypothetical protein NMG60_11033399 [Bertholletia excelsa]
MAACGSLQHIFEKPLAENPTLLESLSSWNHHIKQPTKPLDHSSFTEIFGELHFRENPELLSSSYPPPQGRTEKLEDAKTSSSNNNEGKSSLSDYFSRQYKRSSDGFSLMNTGSLQLCTEGLGFESSDDVEDLKVDMGKDWRNQQEQRITGIAYANHEMNTQHENSSPDEQVRKSRISGGAFPPPISCIGKTGKPWVCFKTYREDGRFVLQEVRVPTQEFLQAHREGGRLKLQFFQPEDEEEEGDDKDEEQEEEDDDDDDDVDDDHKRDDEIVYDNEEEEKDAAEIN